MSITVGLGLMLGFLLPCSGGPAIPLARPNIYLGRRSDADRGAPLTSQSALCRLRFEREWWYIEELFEGATLRVNGERCSGKRLRRLDEIAIGRMRYRIDYACPYDSPELLDEIAESVLFDKSPQEPVVERQQNAVGPAGGEPRINPATPVPGEPPTGTRVPPPGKGAAPSPKGGQSSSLPPREGNVLGCLIPLGGGKDHPLRKSKIQVGRHPQCDVVLPVKTVSGEHCRLELIDGYWHFTDQGSRNGVRVNGTRQQEGWILPGHLVTIGDQRFRLDYVGEGDPPLLDFKKEGSLLKKAGLGAGQLEQYLANEPEDEADSPRKKWNLLDED